jgi:PAS domain-containing protein
MSDLYKDDLFDVYSRLPEVGIALIDRDGHVLRANALFMSMLHVPDDQMQSANYFALTTAADRQRERSEFETLLSGKALLYVIEKRLPTRANKGHYAGILHVECMVMRYGDEPEPFFLVHMQEIKVYRHFNGSQADT